MAVLLGAFDAGLEVGDNIVHVGFAGDGERVDDVVRIKGIGHDHSDHAINELHIDGDVRVIPMRREGPVQPVGRLGIRLAEQFRQLRDRMVS
jgi:hypothetical protein